MKRYFVAPCAEPDGRRTWDVMERAYREGSIRADESTAVGNYDTRAEAREQCRRENDCWEAIGVTLRWRGHVPPPVDSEVYRRDMRDAGRGHLVRP